MSAFTTNAIDRSFEAPRLAFQMLLPTTDRMVYETPAAIPAMIRQVVLCNTHNSAVTIRLHHLLPKDTVAARNALLYELSIPAYSTVVYDPPIYMRAGDMLFARASIASKVAISGYLESSQ